MGRIIFLNCYPLDCISGGIKTTYRHALMLQREGFKVQVIQPGGAPPWLGREMVSLVSPMVCSMITDLTAQDVLVFPETLREWYAEMIRASVRGKKVIFCQNPYYFFTYQPSRQNLEEWGVRRILAPGAYAGRMLQTVLGLETPPAVTSPVVDGSVFRPRTKKLQIVVAHWKWRQQEPLPDYAQVIFQMLILKYPQFADVSRVSLQEKSEDEVAVLLGESAVCLSLGRLESLGVMALEAMASECIVVGYHGGGGQDYATPQNGFWHSPEDMEGVVDSLATALSGFMTGNPAVMKKVEQGRLTARAYGPQRVSEQLRQAYGQLLQEG